MGWIDQNNLVIGLGLFVILIGIIVTPFLLSPSTQTTMVIKNISLNQTDRQFTTLTYDTTVMNTIINETAQDDMTAMITKALLIFLAGIVVLIGIVVGINALANF